MELAAFRKPRLASSITDGRNDGSPMWLPEFRDSRIVRFMNQNGSTVPPDAPWGPMPCVSPICERRDHVFRPPRRLSASGLDGRAVGPDVSPKLQLVSDCHDAATCRRHAEGHAARPVTAMSLCPALRRRMGWRPPLRTWTPRASQSQTNPWRRGEARNEGWR